MSENQSNLSIDKRANQSLVLRWEPIRAQHWDEKSSELSIEMRANKRSVLRWKELRVQYEGWEVLIENQSKLSIMMRSVALCRQTSVDLHFVTGVCHNQSPLSRLQTQNMGPETRQLYICPAVFILFSITDSLLCKSWENETNTFFCFITFQRMIFTRTPFPFCDH